MTSGAELAGPARLTASAALAPPAAHAAPAALALAGWRLFAAARR